MSTFNSLIASLPPWFPRSIFGLVIAVIYAVLASAVVLIERNESGGGGWISLRGMASWLITFPVSAPCDWLDMKPDYKSNLHMLFAIGLCTLLVYFVGAGIGKLASILFTSGGPA